MNSAISTINSQHEDMIHDCQFDYYAKKLATCSSDRQIKIFDSAGHLVNTLSDHNSPVWQVAWAHPKFGVILASCSYDGTVLIHKESSQNVFVIAKKHEFHESSVNSISWASHEFGLILACGSSDGRVSFLEYKYGEWFCPIFTYVLFRKKELKFFQNDSLGCNSVSWAPYSPSTSHTEDGSLVRRLVTGSCDNTVRIWKCFESADGIVGSWTEELKVSKASPHSDWVRDVAWAPNGALPYNIIASCSEDRTVYIWKQTDKGTWEASKLHFFDAPVWRVSWSITGSVLAVSSGDHKVTLWKQSVDETWVQISTIEENDATIIK